MSEDKKIRSVKAFRITHSLISNRTDTEREPAYYYEFDANGNRLLEVTYNDGEEEQKTERAYANSHLTEETIHFITDEMFEKVSYVYNDEGLLVKSNREYSDGSVESAEYTYEGKNLIRKVIVNDEGDVEEEDIFSYEKDRMISHQRKEDGEITLIVKRKYDEQGNLIEEERDDRQEENHFKVLYTPAGANKAPDMKVMNSSGKVVEALAHVYDENGRLLREIMESNYKGFKRHDTSYVYDDIGRIIAEETIDQNGLVRKRVSREYDGDHIVLAEHLHEENPETGLLYDMTTEFEYTFW